MMDESSQVHVPPSFLALFTAPGGLRLTEPLAHVHERYELCEDLAQMLTEQASAKLFELGITEQDVLDKMLEALTGPQSPVPPPQAHWVVQRLAELMGWGSPGHLPGGPV